LSVRFSFEDLQWIPLDVRRKLDLAGLKLSLEAWQHLSTEQREQLIAANDEFAALVTSLCAPGRIATTTPWRSEEALLAIEEAARALGIAIDRARMDDAARYALSHLASRDEEKFRTAIAELGVAF
jgi:hypothetical protein